MGGSSCIFIAVSDFPLVIVSFYDFDFMGLDCVAVIFGFGMAISVRPRVCGHSLIPPCTLKASYYTNVLISTKYPN